MKTFFTKTFKKHYTKRILPYKNLDKRFEERRALFLQNPKHPLLDDHALKGSRSSFRSFSITGDIRLIYYLEGETAYFIDIGTHNQVY